MDHRLLNPNQMHNPASVVNDTPLHYLKPRERVPTAYSLLSEDGSLHIPFCLDGIISYFETRCPTKQEIYLLDTLYHFKLMNSIPIWTLNDSAFTADELQMTLLSQQMKSNSDGM